MEHRIVTVASDSNYSDAWWFTVLLYFHVMNIAYQMVPRHIL